jgi:hypothetical protein
MPHLTRLRDPLDRTLPPERAYRRVAVAPVAIPGVGHSVKSVRRQVTVTFCSWLNQR